MKKIYHLLALVILGALHSLRVTIFWICSPPTPEMQKVLSVR